MPEAHAKIAINLLPKKKPDFSEKFLSWLLTFGRFIIIVTELIVFAVFISRFYLDTRLTELTDQIVQKETILQSLENNEKAARNLQIRLSHIKNLQTATSPNDVLKLVSSLTPQSVSLVSFAIDKDLMTITASTNSNNGFSLFVNNLRLSEKFSDVTLGTIEKDESLGAISFALTANLVKEKNNGF